VLRRVASAGASALGEAAIARALLSVAGRAEGGLLSEDDLSTVRPSSAKPLALGAEQRGRTVWIAPWESPALPGRRQEVILAADARGVLGALSYAPDDQGVEVPDLDLCVPRDAAVVRRGVPRVRPGEALPCLAPVAIAGDQGLALCVFAVATGAVPPHEAIAEAWQKPGATAADALAAFADSAAAIGIVRTPEHGSVQPVR
jgi:hypothetical protein